MVLDRCWSFYVLLQGVWSAKSELCGADAQVAAQQSAAEGVWAHAQLAAGRSCTCAEVRAGHRTR